MKRHTLLMVVCVLSVCFILSSCLDKSTFAREAKLNDFYQKKNVTIALIDSGLGGLSILAEAVEKMKENRMFSMAHFIFFNSLFSEEEGYSRLKTQNEQVLIFDSALKSLAEYGNPDLILIGCSTLSALYEKTPFSRQTDIPVVGIIESEVELIVQSLKSRPEAQVILFATQDTIHKRIHQNLLVESGFLAERIITQACPDLVQHIERGTSSDETEMLMMAYADEALQNLSSDHTPLFVSFNCTHYGYSLDLWKKVFKNLGSTPESFLNPNSQMIRFLFRPALRNRVRNTQTSVRMVSMVKIGEEELFSIGQRLEDLSPQTAEALRKYEYRENLFAWKEFVTPEK